MDDDDADADELYHPPFVVTALDWAEGLSPNQLLVAAQIKDEKASGFLPPAALVRIIRRLRSDGAQEPSNRLVEMLIVRAYDYVRRALSEQVAPGCGEMLALLDAPLQTEACQPFSLLPFITRDDPPGRDVVRAVPAVAAERGRPAVRARI